MKNGARFSRVLFCLIFVQRNLSNPATRTNSFIIFLLKVAASKFRNPTPVQRQSIAIIPQLSEIRTTYTQFDWYPTSTPEKPKNITEGTNERSRGPLAIVELVGVSLFLTYTIPTGRNPYLQRTTAQTSPQQQRREFDTNVFAQIPTQSDQSTPILGSV